jgi:probable HAF family extracellular repeat protein
MAVNDSDQVAGTVFVAQDVNYAFRWTSSGGMQDLGSLAPDIHDTRANGINATGDIVGLSFPSNGVEHAFLWTENGGMKDLGDLPNGFDDSVALGVNASDEVVGYSTDSAFIWTNSDGMQNLEDLLGDSSAGWTLFQASAINDAGQIVGYGASPDGDIHAFLLTPVPEPASAALMAIGALLLGSPVGHARGIRQSNEAMPFSISARRWLATKPQADGDKTGAALRSAQFAPS